MLGIQVQFRGWASSCLLLAIGALVLMPSACERRDCEEERRHCEGSTLVSCVSPCADVGCHRTWEYEQCAHACVESEDGWPFCALSSVPDPDCVAPESCGPDGPIACLYGYRTREGEKCAAGTQCVSAEERTFCAVSGAPDPRCADITTNEATCFGKELVRCALGFAVEDLNCSEACVSGVGCALSDAPDPRCAVSYPEFAYCDDDTTLVSCVRGYQVEREACSCLEQGQIVGRAYCG